MRLTPARTLLAAGLTALAGTASAVFLVAGPASAGPTAAGTASPAVTLPVVLTDCHGHSLVRPRTYDLFCMESNEYLAGLKWTTWTSAAFGGGVLKVNSCIPSCARGRYVNYPILTVLWRAQPWPNHPGRRHFTRLTWILTGKRPAGAAVTRTFKLP
ncbi:MAG TPA: hypothetical protein VNF47_27735 [Streptosporangiaceae bacterium]|nr:hypothetical protein [Streptosporangiaceae bacterium]